jgi:hypothetical protein
MPIFSKHLQLSIMFEGEDRIDTLGQVTKCTPLRSDPASAANIRLGCNKHFIILLKS